MGEVTSELDQLLILIKSNSPIFFFSCAFRVTSKNGQVQGHEHLPP